METQKEASQPTIENKDIVTFHNDAGVRETEIAQASISEDYFKMSRQENDNSIISFLERPKLFRYGTFTSNDVYGNIGGVGFLPTSVVDLFNQPLVKNKLQGVFGIKYDLELEIVLNATRFAQGLYAIYFVPTGGGDPTIAPQWVGSHVTRDYNRSQLHHVKFDLNCDTRAILNIPWCCVSDFMPLSGVTTGLDHKNIGVLGSFFIAPYTTTSNLQPATESASYSLYWRLKNIQLVGSGAYPQMDVTEFEAKSKGVGPVESMSLKVGTLLDRFKNFPLLSNYVTPLSWVNDIVGTTANVFGWSKPANYGAPMRIKREPFASLNLVDVVDDSSKLSLFSTNKVGVLPGFSGSQKDELDISTFCSRFSIVSYANWAATGAVGDSIIQWQNQPDGVVYSHSSTPYWILQSPLQLAASMFRMWRGSIRYRLRFVKTEFHSGRLEISFVPNYNGLGVLTTPDSWDYKYREIIDLRYVNEFCFEIPYISPTPYMSIADLNSTGILQFRILDPLKAPPNVSSSVVVILEHAGGDDIEFAYPSKLQTKVLYDVTPQMDTSDCADVSKVFSNMVKVKDSLEPSKASVGERLMNFRALGKRFIAMPFGSSSYVPPANSNSMYISAFTVPICDLGAPDARDRLNNTDYYGLFSSVFAISRGGVRIKFISPSIKTKTLTEGDVGTQTQLFGSASIVERDTYNPNVQRSKLYVPLDNPVRGVNSWLGSTVLFNSLQEHGVEIEVPQYSIAHSRASSDFRLGGRYVFPQHQGTYYSKVPDVEIYSPMSDFNTSTNAADYPCVMRAFSEDTNFGTFVSVPPLLFGPD